MSYQKCCARTITLLHKEHSGNGAKTIFGDLLRIDVIPPDKILLFKVVFIFQLATKNYNEMLGFPIQMPSLSNRLRDFDATYDWAKFISPWSFHEVCENCLVSVSN